MSQRGASEATDTDGLSRAANTACAAVLAVEAVGALLIWVPLPLAWLWVGGRVYDSTHSIAADAGVAFFGFVATTLMAMTALGRVDRGWVALRRRAGHHQDQGALANVMVVTTTLALVLFLLWFYVASKKAFIIPFMPTQ